MFEHTKPGPLPILEQTVNQFASGENGMGNRGGIDTPMDKVGREVARERHERELHDEAKAGLASHDDFRTKDARERDDTSALKRHPGR
jgi:hypothetical protein